MTRAFDLAASRLLDYLVVDWLWAGRHVIQLVCVDCLPFSISIALG